jgi:hypothetical protein
MLVLILLIIISLSVIFTNDKEEFYGGYIMPWATRINRPTRNMSYDLRGEVCYPPLLNLPFDNSSIAPILQPEFADKVKTCV